MITDQRFLGRILNQMGSYVSSSGMDLKLYSGTMPRGLTTFNANSYLSTVVYASGGWKFEADTANVVLRIKPNATTFAPTKAGKITWFSLTTSNPTDGFVIGSVSTQAEGTGVIQLASTDATMGTNLVFVQGGFKLSY